MMVTMTRKTIIYGIQYGVTFVVTIRRFLFVASVVVEIALESIIR
jgi:hypothetical protein